MGRNGYKALIVFLCLLAACKKDQPEQVTGRFAGSLNDVFIVCEGNFGNSNASLYAYDRAKDSVYGDIYQGVNNAVLGDVFQSMARIGEQYFLCVNNSDKVVVLNRSTLSVADVIYLPKPRYVLPVNESKAYVSSEYSNRVYVLDPQTHQVSDTIMLPYQNTEGMCLAGNYVFVCPWDTICNTVCKVDVGTNRVVQTIPIAGYAPQEAVVDKDGKVWILSGNQPERKVCALTKIDPESGNILFSYIFPDAADAVKPVFNETKDTLYFIEADYYGGTANNGIYRMAITENEPQLFVAAKAFQYFWGLGIDPITGYIYGGDPKGFVQKGTVYVYKQSGDEARHFDVGLGPGHFYFDQ